MSEGEARRKRDLFRTQSKDSLSKNSPCTLMNRIASGLGSLAATVDPIALSFGRIQESTTNLEGSLTG